MENTAPHLTNSSAAHEHRDANVRLILFSTVILIITVVTACFVTVGVFDWLNTSAPEAVNSAVPVNPNPIPPVPRVLEHPWEELPDLHAHENEILYSYGWVDKANGVVRIPVDRAMDLVLARGLPTTAPAAAAKPAKAPAAAAKKVAVKQDVVQ